VADPFPPSEFDSWAETYDQDTASNAFPFTGYAQALDAVVKLAAPRTGMHVLDVGTGTGTLARRFLEAGCRVTATDFSPAMLDQARKHIPEARLIQADLRDPLLVEVAAQHFDRIVSGYVFHHFELPEKIAILHKLAELLPANGCLVIADISFPDQPAFEAVKRASDDTWEDEFYWIANEAIQALEQAEFAVEYRQVSSCAGVYRIIPCTIRQITA